MWTKQKQDSKCKNITGIIPNKLVNYVFFFFKSQITPLKKAKWASLRYHFCYGYLAPCIKFCFQNYFYSVIVLVLLPKMLPLEDEGSALSCHALFSLSLWECDPMLINLFLTMFGPPPKPQAHALSLCFLFCRFFQSWTLAGEGGLPSLM